MRSEECEKEGVLGKVSSASSLRKGDSIGTKC